MPSFISAHKKLKARSTSKRRKTRLVKRKGDIKCVCKKVKGNSYTSDIIIGGKIINKKSVGSSVNHLRLKRAKGMDEGVWALTGGFDNPCKCTLSSGGKSTKKRVLKGINMVSLKWV